MTTVVVGFVTAASVREGRLLAKTLVEERLAACVNLTGAIESRYRWQGRVETGREVLLIIKTQRKQMKKVIARVKALHSYTVPEVIFVPVTDGNPDYVKWVRESANK